MWCEASAGRLLLVVKYVQYKVHHVDDGCLRSIQASLDLGFSTFAQEIRGGCLYFVQDPVDDGYSNIPPQTAIVVRGRAA